MIQYKYSNGFFDFLDNKCLYISSCDKNLIVRISRSGHVEAHYNNHVRGFGVTSSGVPYLPSYKYVRNPHEIANGLLIVDPDRNQITGETTGLDHWRPWWCDNDAADCCHLSGISECGRYVTSFSESSEPSGWRNAKAGAGVIADTKKDTILMHGLTMPHSPRVHNGILWVCDSGNGWLRNEGGIVSRHRGITRGLTFAGNYAFVGLSKIRASNVFSEMTVENTECGVDVVNTRSGETVASLRLDGVSEVFGVVQL